jgi:hypothetical protein
VAIRWERRLARPANASRDADAGMGQAPFLPGAALTLALAPNYCSVRRNRLPR